ncbi:DUF6153 family protein [Microbacterium sp. X-17]|uniref:DUF6153 family protein n=1 Tax=Microbacterium sp. X-17 TaxID=3144404 RepID=UPI0031F48507
MRRIRALTGTRSRAHGLLLTFAMAVAVIAGLLAMHTMTAASAPSAHAAAAVHAAMGEAPAPDPAPASDDCGGDCSHGGASDHSMLLTMCVLALVAAVVVLIAPGLMRRAAAPPATLARRMPAHALPWPRPPSLLVLSISRT